MKKGFTLIELLLSVAVITLIAGFSVPVYQSFQNRNDLDLAATTVAQSLRRAAALSQAVDGDTAWGICVDSGSMTLFKGSNYSARDAEFDEIFSLSESITPSGLSEIVFEKFSGYPLNFGTVTLTSVNNDVRNIAINEKGSIQY